MQKYLISDMILYKGGAVSGLKGEEPFGDGDAVSLARDYALRGADALLIFDRSSGDREHDESLDLLRQITRTIDIPVYGAGNVQRAEDVKKLLYAGCAKAVLNFSKESNRAMLSEVSARFGKEKIAVCIDPAKEQIPAGDAAAQIREYAGEVILLSEDAGKIKEALSLLPEDLPVAADCCGGAALSGEERKQILRAENLSGLAEPFLKDPEADILGLKLSLCDEGFEMAVPASSVTWQDLKTDANGLVPVVVQDCKNDEVLMVAWMNEEAFDLTVRTGRMTYFSRSRQSLWVKGETSGHYQYVRELRIDCDNDTLLARVVQIGAACHTGNRSCFYRTFQKRGGEEKDPMRIFEEVYGVIEDRRVHPKEGSYTNYLFDKGLDKILKKIGEEATETVIAAKNPDPEEARYEIADLLYHLMVLMVERGIAWEDVCEELANR